jgi:hypothetical protein
MTDVTLTLKVKDQITKETQKVWGKFIEDAKKAATATKDFLANFDARAFGAVFKGIGKLNRSFMEFGDTLNTLTPDAKKFAVVMSKDTVEGVRAAAESFNHLKAAADGFFARLIASMPSVKGLMDDIAARLAPKLELAKRAQLEQAVREAAAAKAAGPSLRANEKGSALYNEALDLSMAWSRAVAALAEYDRVRSDAEQKAIRSREVADQDNERRIRQRNEAGGIPLLGEIPRDEQRDPWFSHMRQLAILRDATRDKSIHDDMSAMEEYSQFLDEMNQRADDARLDEIQNFIDAEERMRQKDAEIEEDARKARLEAERARLQEQLQDYYDYLSDKEDAERAYAEEMARLAEERAREIERYAEVLTGNFDQFFSSLITGTDNLGRAFTKMIGGMIADVGRMMAHDEVVKFMRSIVGAISGGGGETIPGLSASELNLIGGDVAGHASGGFVGAGKPTLVGERGPELFVPQTAGNIVTNSRTGGGGLGNVTINITESGDPRKTASEVRSALMHLLSNDMPTRARVRSVAGGFA